MYIFRYALKSIRRSKGRNILIGIIALVIAVSSCVALSIRESAVKVREDTLDTLQITAQIARDRQSMMSGSGQGSFSKEDMQTLLQSGSGLSLEELQTYAGAEAVKSFYYTVSASLDAGDSIDPVDDAGTFSREDSSSTSSDTAQTPPNGKGGGTDSGFDFSKMGGGRFGSQGDFTLTGYSSDESMTDFISGVSKITAGQVFDTATDAAECIINQELATLNSISVGDTITLLNPNNAEETVTLTVVGIYETTATGSAGIMSGFSTAVDSANQIYMSYPALTKLAEASASAAETAESDESAATTAITTQLSGTYTFASVEDYEAFDAQARALGLADDYTVSSTDLTAFESSLTPLENLGTMAGWFLLVVFAIGAVILVVLNIFNIRERKYEIGVLTAIGMKKRKVAAQFVAELFTVTLAAILLGAAIGAAVSVPVTNALLENQIASNTASAQTMQQGFGRPTDGGSGMTAMPGNTDGDSDAATRPQGGKNFMDRITSSATSYISSVSYSTDLTVILELLGVGVLLTLISSLAAVTFIMRYEPLNILSNRD